VATHLANQAAWTALGVTHHASGIASAINTAATSASWLGAGSLASAASVTALNASLHGLAGWVDIKPAVVGAAVTAYETANATMRPAPECMENRDEYVADNVINPAVLWTLTPRITSLDLEYFGMMWPNNSAVGATYGGMLEMLGDSLTIPPPIAAMGASPAAPAQAASAIGDAAVESGAGGGMRATQVGTSGAGQSVSAGQGMGSELGTFMEPVQSLMGAVPQALQAPSQLIQGPMSSLMGPLQSIMGMFANGGAGATPAGSLASAAGALSGVEAGSMGAGSGGASMLGAGVPATSFTRPVSAFESGSSGRPVGLRLSGALGADAVRPPTTTSAGAGGAPIGGMPVGHAAGGGRGAHDKSEQPATVRVVDARL
jgi:PPE family